MGVLGMVAAGLSVGLGLFFAAMAAWRRRQRRWQRDLDAAEGLLTAGEAAAAAAQLTALVDEAGPFLLDDEALRLDLLSARGRARLATGHPADAEDDLKEAIRHGDPRDGAGARRAAPCLAGLARIYLGRGRLPEAAALAEQATQVGALVFAGRDPRLAELHAVFGDCLAAQGDHGGARTHWTRALEIFSEYAPPGDPEVTRLEGRLAAAPGTQEGPPSTSARAAPPAGALIH